MCATLPLSVILTNQIMTHHRSQIDYTYNQLKSIVHNHIYSDSICDGASQPLKLDLMITWFDDNFQSGGPIRAYDQSIWSLQHQDHFGEIRLRI